MTYMAGHRNGHVTWYYQKVFNHRTTWHEKLDMVFTLRRNSGNLTNSKAFILFERPNGH